MEEVLAFLTENQIFYLATLDGDKPRVRPFGFVMAHDGKLYFCLNNQKKVYQQLQSNANLEISATSADKRWLRLSGKAVFNTTPAIKAKALELAPFLKNRYAVEDSLFELFYLTDAEATINSPSGDIKTVTF